jgi:hypothetical protein
VACPVHDSARAVSPALGGCARFSASDVGDAGVTRDLHWRAPAWGDPDIRIEGQRFSL